MALDSLPHGAGHTEQDEAMSCVAKWTSAVWEGRRYLTPVKDISDRTLSFCARFRLCMALGGPRSRTLGLAGVQELGGIRFRNRSRRLHFTS